MEKLNNEEYLDEEVYVEGECEADKYEIGEDRELTPEEKEKAKKWNEERIQRFVEEAKETNEKLRNAYEQFYKVKTPANALFSYHVAEGDIENADIREGSGDIVLTEESVKLGTYIRWFVPTE